MPVNSAMCAMDVEAYSRAMAVTQVIEEVRRTLPRETRVKNTGRRDMDPYAIIMVIGFFVMALWNYRERSRYPD